jgi:hypothetical protein
VGPLELIGPGCPASPASRDTRRLTKRRCPFGHIGYLASMWPEGPYVIGRGDKIRTCDPLHPMDSMAKRDETLCHALNRVIIRQIPYFLGFSTLFALRVVS